MRTLTNWRWAVYLQQHLTQEVLPMNTLTVPRPQTELWRTLSPEARQRLLALLSRWALRRWTTQRTQSGGNHERVLR